METTKTGKFIFYIISIMSLIPAAIIDFIYFTKEPKKEFLSLVLTNLNRIVSFCLLIILLYFLYRGSKIAKNTIILLCSVGIIIFLHSIFTVGFNIYVFIIALAYLIIIVLLFKSGSLKSFMEYQKIKFSRKAV